MTFEELRTFVEKDMRMSHIYQPIMIEVLLSHGGRASISEIAHALLIQDRSQLEYYAETTKNMVGRVLTKRGVVQRAGDSYELSGFSHLSADQIEELKTICERKLDEYVSKRGDVIWDHRRKSSGYISGTLRYEVLKNAKFHCLLCGVSADVRALEVDHIVPRNKGGTDDISNLQALCYSCNAMKRDTDSTDFRLIQNDFGRTDSSCPFCSIKSDSIVLQNSLAVVFRDQFPVSEWHLLVIPKRHVASYFDLGTAEVNACQRLLQEARELILCKDANVSGFNVGINCGEHAGQTVMHCHIHLIPRRANDHPNPRGGVRSVFPGKADYR